MIKTFKKQISQKMVLGILVITLLTVLIVTPITKATAMTTQSSSSINTDSLSQTSLTKLLLSQGDDPYINKSMSQICQDLFGNTTGPTNVPTKSTSQFDSPTSGQACLVVAIYNYPGDVNNANNQNAYTGLMYNVNTAGYTMVEPLLNDAATHQNVWEWVTWLCASYEYVDVYFIGEGYNYWDLTYGFVPWDAWNNDNIIINNLYYPTEMVTNGVHPYDYTELRLGVGDFCYSGNFAHSFVTQNYGNTYYFGDRVWIGDSNTVFSYYGSCFLSYWSYYYYYYLYLEDSLTAFNNAYNSANPYDSPPYTPYTGFPFSYYDSVSCGGPYYPPLTW